MLKSVNNFILENTLRCYLATRFLSAVTSYDLYRMKTILVSIERFLLRFECWKKVNNEEKEVKKIVINHNDCQILLF